MQTATDNHSEVNLPGQHLEEVYTAAFPAVARLVHKLGGTYSEARDLFHDALVIYQEKVAESGLPPAPDPVAYLLGICKHLWLRKHRHHKQRLPLNEVEQTLAIPDDYFPGVDSEKLLRLLERTGQKCLNLLRAFYFQSQPLAELAAQFGLRSVHSAAVQKYKCLEKARQTVLEKDLSHADFLN